MRKQFTRRGDVISNLTLDEKLRAGDMVVNVKMNYYWLEVRKTEKLGVSCEDKRYRVIKVVMKIAYNEAFE